MCVVLGKKFDAHSLMLEAGEIFNVENKTAQFTFLEEFFHYVSLLMFGFNA